MKKFIITENEKHNILGMYGLINEQSSGLNLPNEIFQIITDIEARFSFCEGGIVNGEPKYKGKAKLSVFTEYVKGTIGFDTWNKLDNNTKAQIYSFAYQTDTTAGKPKYWWVKGLAQAIDSNFDRVNGSPEEAIKIIKSSKKLGSIYSDYLKTVKDQYANITMGPETECNRKKIWGPRPDAIDRMLNGEDHEKVLDDWEQTYINPKPIKTTTNTQTTNKPSQKQNELEKEINFKINSNYKSKEVSNLKHNDELKPPIKNTGSNKPTIKTSSKDMEEW